MQRIMIGLGLVTLTACGGGNGPDVLNAPALEGQTDIELQAQASAFAGNLGAGATDSLPSAEATYRGYLLLTQERAETETVAISPRGGMAEPIFLEPTAPVVVEVRQVYTAIGEAALNVDFETRRIAGQAGGFKVGTLDPLNPGAADLSETAGSVTLATDGFDAADVAMSVTGDLTLDGVSQKVATTLDGAFYGTDAQALAADGAADFSTSGSFDIYLGALAE